MPHKSSENIRIYFTILRGHYKQAQKNCQTINVVRGLTNQVDFDDKRTSNNFGAQSVRKGSSSISMKE